MNTIANLWRMDWIRELAWFAEQSVSTLGYVWQVTLPLVVGFLAIFVIHWVRPVSRKLFSKRLFLLALPLGISLLILIWGFVMEHPANAQSSAPNWPGYVFVGLLIVQLVLSIWLVWTMKGFRWLAVFGRALQMWSR